MRKIDVWDIVLWFCLAIMFIWALLKSFGVISSPLWVEMIPYFTGIGALAAFSFKAGGVFQRFKVMEGNVSGIKEDVHYLKSRTDDIDKRLISLTNYVYLKVK